MTLSKPEDSDAEESPTYEQRSLKPGQSAYPQPGSVEFSAPLETSVSLEAPRQIYTSVSNVSNRIPSPTELPLQTEPPLQIEPVDEQLSPAVPSVAEETIQLLEERLVVNRSKRKVGEVIVRKEIETRVVEVLVRREKLVVEQVSPEYKQLAVVNLGQGQEDQLDIEAASKLPATVEGKFTSVTAAIKFLEAIAAQSDSGLQSVQISILLKDATLQDTYQRLLEQSSARIFP